MCSGVARQFPRLKPNRESLEPDEEWAGAISTHQYARPEGGANEALGCYGHHLLQETHLFDAQKDPDGTQEQREHD